MNVAIVKRGWWRAIAAAAIFGTVFAAAAPAAQAHWWVHRPFVRSWHHAYYHHWGFHRPWWRPVYFRPFFAPRPFFYHRVVVVRPPVVYHRVVVVHTPPRVVYRTRVIYHTVVHHPVHHTHAIHYSYQQCGCQP